MKTKIRHYAFPDFSIALPVNWLVDPFQNKNWRHHFNSLRWLATIDDLSEIRALLLSFYNFHCVKKKFNPYYSTLVGDHTAAIRIGVLRRLREKFLESGVVGAQGLCNRLITEELVNLQRPAMYRAGHNHGLMVDIALLDFWNEDEKFRTKIDLDLVLHRSEATFGAMWHPSGYTREHSVSYQEFNLDLAFQYLRLLNSLGVKQKNTISAEALLDESRRILGYALRGDSDFFPIGDSFRRPNLKLLSRVFGLSEECVIPALRESIPAVGFLLKEGLFVKKWICGEPLKEFHLIATCGWNSSNHKQNDEFSFCLDVNKIPFFDDPGYTGAFDGQLVASLKSEQSHSNFSVEGLGWTDKRVPDGNSQILLAEEPGATHGSAIEMTHTRIKGFVSKRKIAIKENVINIVDRALRAPSVCAEKENETNCSGWMLVHRFVLASQVKVKLHERFCELESNDQTCRLHFERGSASLEYVSSVGAKKNELLKSPVIVLSALFVPDQWGVVNRFRIEIN